MTLSNSLLVLAIVSSWNVVTSLLTDSGYDFYKFPKSIPLKDGQHFDYIVVGAGAGGATAASRLALAGYEVLLVEAGGDPNVLTRIPAASMALLASSMDWNYEIVPNNMSCLSSVGQQCRYSSGKGLGGSTSINHMLYVRGNRLKDFEEIPLPGWTFDDFMPYFLRYEGLQDLALLPPSSKPYHNTTGPISLEFFDDPQISLQTELVNAYGSLQFPFNSDINAESQIGITKVIGYVYEGERMSTARGFLARQDVKSRLKFSKNTFCTGIITREKTVLGITVIKGSEILKLFAKKEVILSAGTIGTPQILMLSGVGPADHLTRYGIPVKVDLPVGNTLIDHVLPVVVMQIPKRAGLLDKLLSLKKIATQLGELVLERRGALTSNGLTDFNIFANTLCYDFERRQLINESSNVTDCEVPNMQIIHAYMDRYLVPLIKPFLKNIIGFEDDVLDQMAEANEKYAFVVLSPVLLDPQSMGTVRLASSDPLTPPAITPNYLSDERDVEALVRSIRILEDMVATPGLRRLGASLLKLRLSGCPRYAASRRQYWRCYVRHMTHAVYHAVGTAPLGAVLDARLRVRGLTRLRVADLSALPRPPRANPTAVTIAIGERVVDFLLEDNA